jgi:hypothetical protein
LEKFNLSHRANTHGQVPSAPHRVLPPPGTRVTFQATPLRNDAKFTIYGTPQQSNPCDKSFHADVFSFEYCFYLGLIPYISTSKQ